MSVDPSSVNTNQAALNGATVPPVATPAPTPVITAPAGVTKLFSTLREWAHAAVAIIGLLTAGVAGVVTTVNSFGIHITDLQAIQGLGIAGGIATLISKLIDSANNAFTTPS
jgi:hypothetical protein